MTKLIKCNECDGTGTFSKGVTPKECPWCDGSGQVKALWIVKAHCASGWTELVGVYESRSEASKAARREVKQFPVTECGTGGVKWAELFGPDIEESIGFERAGTEIIETGV